MTKDHSKYPNSLLEELYQHFLDTGDNKFIGIIFKKIYPTLLVRMKKFTNNDEVIKDAISDLFLIILIKKYPSIHNIIAYFQTATRHKIINDLKHQNRYVEFQHNHLSDSAVYGQEYEMIAEELYDDFVKILSNSFKGDEVKKAAVKMRYAGYKNEEVIRELGDVIKPQQINRGVRTIKEKFLNIHKKFSYLNKKK